jgi:hypothetical protein
MRGLLLQQRSITPHWLETRLSKCSSKRCGIFAKPERHGCSELHLDGITMTASSMERASKKAAKEGFTCLIIQLDTPGGLLSSTKEIVQQFLSPA